MQFDTNIENFNNVKVQECKNEDPGSNVDQLINKIIANKGYITFKVNKKYFSTNGGNYLGELCEINVVGKTKYGDEETMNLFVKNMAAAEGLKILSLTDVYKTELFAYTELSKITTELQEDANVPLEERFKMVRSYKESNCKTIILDNMTKKGYKTYHRMDVVSLAFAEKAIKELAKLHGISFVLQMKRPEYFEAKIKAMKPPYIFGKDWDGLGQSVFDIIKKNSDPDVIEKIENVYFDITRLMQKYHEDESSKCCMCHGDFRPNNIMTKFINSEAVDVVPVDYQLLHYGCPVLDFLYFTFGCTDKEFRKQHLIHLKDHYHQSMTQFLQYFDIDINDVYPREKFEKMYKEKLDYGLLYGCLFLPFMMVVDEEVPDLNKDMKEMGFQVDQRFRERFRGVVEDFVEWGYI